MPFVRPPNWGPNHCDSVPRFLDRFQKRWEMSFAIHPSGFFQRHHRLQNKAGSWLWYVPLCWLTGYIDGFVTQISQSQKLMKSQVCSKDQMIFLKKLSFVSGTKCRAAMYSQKWLSQGADWAPQDITDIVDRSSCMNEISVSSEF